MRAYVVTWVHRDADELGADVHLFTDQDSAVEKATSLAREWGLTGEWVDGPPIPASGSLLYVADDSTDYEAETCRVDIRFFELYQRTALVSTTYV
jgi:hypothetical protein